MQETNVDSKTIALFMVMPLLTAVSDSAIHSEFCPGREGHYYPHLGAVWIEDLGKLPARSNTGGEQ